MGDRLSNIERWTLRPDGTYDGPMAEYESVVREAAYVGASAGQAAFKAEVEQLRGAVEDERALCEQILAADMGDWDRTVPLLAQIAEARLRELGAVADLHDDRGFYQPPGLPDPVTPHQLAVEILDTLERINRQRAQIGATPLEQLDPRDLVAQVGRLTESLTWSVDVDGRLTDERASEACAYLLAFRLARARVDELDITAGSDAA